MIGTARPVRRSEPFGNDAFAAKRACVFVNDGAIALIMLVERDPRMSAAQQLSQKPLPLLNSLPRMSSPPSSIRSNAQSVTERSCRRQRIISKTERPFSSQANRLAIDGAGARSQRGYRSDDERKPLAEIVSVAGNQPYTRGIALRQDAEAVVFDFVNPTGSRRRRFCQARQARFKAKRRLLGA
jgi:hypothetical protein